MMVSGMYDWDQQVVRGEYGMRIFGKSAAALVGVLVTVGASATIAFAQTPVGIAQAPGTETQQQAQAEAVPGLNAAIAAGDVNALDAMVAANANNPAVQAQIAAAILVGAQAAKDSNPTLAGMLAAIAVASGGLVGTNAVVALNLVVSNPTTMALLTNPNAPAFTSNFFASLAVPNRPIGVATSGIIAAENSAQSSGSNN
jgi:phosphohistidine swiveling domain-containing protein